MAPNLEVSTAEGGLDDTVEDLIELARENEVQSDSLQFFVVANDDFFWRMYLFITCVWYCFRSISMNECSIFKHQQFSFPVLPSKSHSFVLERCQ